MEITTEVKSPYRIQMDKFLNKLSSPIKRKNREENRM